MFFTRRIGSTYQSFHGLSLVAILSVGCAPGIHVQTATAPDANLSGARTYRFLHRAERAVGGNPAQSTNPLIESPIVAEEIQRDVTDELNVRGYALQPDMADLSVAFYGSVQRRLEVTDYDYGYPFWGWRWRWGPAWGGMPVQQVTSFQQGTIVIDVLDASGTRLLWRGVGRTRVPHDEHEYAEAIARVVHAIMSRFPGRATAP